MIYLAVILLVIAGACVGWAGLVQRKATMYLVGAGAIVLAILGMALL